MNDISTLMARVEEINRINDVHEITDDHIATLITYHRRNRARKSAGLKADKPTTTTVNLIQLLNLPAPRPSGLPTITRR
jgi:hypothetical protein